MSKTVKYIGFTIAGLLIIILYFSKDPSASTFPKCPLYSTTGIYCPGCGSQRAFHDLLHLNLIGIAKNNILFLVLVLISLYELTITIINRFYDKRLQSILNQKKALLLMLLFVVIYWILRNIPIYPFTLLAPN